VGEVARVLSSNAISYYESICGCAVHLDASFSTIDVHMSLLGSYPTNKCPSLSKLGVEGTVRTAWHSDRAVVRYLGTYVDMHTWYTACYVHTNSGTGTFEMAGTQGLSRRGRGKGGIVPSNASTATVIVYLPTYLCTIVISAPWSLSCSG